MSNCPFSSLAAGNLRDSRVTAPLGGGLLLSHNSSSDLQSQKTSTYFIPRVISTPGLHHSTSRLTDESSSSHPAAAIDGHQPFPSASAGSSTCANSQKLTRRQLRKLNTCWKLSEVRKHARKDDAWIAVDGRVYDITEHLLYHPGWNDTAAISTALSVLAHSGSDCSKEFRDIHRPYPVAWRQLAAYYIGDLAPHHEPHTPE